MSDKEIRVRKLWPAKFARWMLLTVCLLCVQENIAMAQPDSTRVRANIRSQLVITKNAADRSCRASGLTKSMFRKLLNEKFTSLLSPSSANGIGNFGAYDSKDGSLSFAGTTSVTRWPLTNVKVAGNGSNGILGIRSDGQANSKVSLDVQFHTLTTKNSLTYPLETCIAYDLASQKARDNYALRRDQFAPSLAILLAKRSLLRLNDDSSARAAMISTLQISTKRSLHDNIVLDSLRIVQTIGIDSLRMLRRDTIPAADTTLERLENDVALGNIRAKEILEAEKKLEIAGFTIHWLSIGFGYANTTFKLFDSTATFASQVKTVASQSLEAQGQFSIYYIDSKKVGSGFFTVGAKTARSDNFDVLTKFDLTDTRQFGPDAHDREQTKKTTAYAGDYKRDLSSLSLFVNWYGFVPADNSVAVHLYPTVIMKNSEKGTVNAGAGFVVLYKKKNENDSGSQSLVNAEIFYEAKDLWSVQQSELSFWKRGDIGLRFTLPIIFAAKSDK